MIVRVMYIIIYLFFWKRYDCVFVGRYEIIVQASDDWAVPIKVKIQASRRWLSYSRQTLLLRSL